MIISSFLHHPITVMEVCFCSIWDQMGDVLHSKRSPSLKLIFCWEEYEESLQSLLWSALIHNLYAFAYPFFRCHDNISFLCLSGKKQNKEFMCMNFKIIFFIFILLSKNSNPLSRSYLCFSYIYIYIYIY